LTKQLRLSVCSFLVHLKLVEHVEIVRHTSCNEWNDITYLFGHVCPSVHAEAEFNIYSGQSLW